MVAMVGVILLSLLGLSQGDMDPGVAAQTTIRQEISSGVDADNIIFKKRDVDGVLHDEPPLTRKMVYAQITEQHNVHNAVTFLEGATVDFYECLRALYAKERYTTAGALNAWGRLHCGDWTTTDPAPATMVDNLMWTTTRGNLPLGGDILKQRKSLLRLYRGRTNCKFSSKTVLQ